MRLHLKLVYYNLLRSMTLFQGVSACSDCRRLALIVWFSYSNLILHLISAALFPFSPVFLSLGFLFYFVLFWGFVCLVVVVVLFVWGFLLLSFFFFSPAASLEGLCCFIEQHTITLFQTLNL